MTYQPIIGLEVHVELATKSKMFCGCPAEHFGITPNTHTCPVCLGLPGALPVTNRKAVDWTILLGLALDCQVNQDSKFDRKNYFYPDLPKGYQITQYDQPLCTDGYLELHKTVSREAKDIKIRRVHLEEDTGKLQHTEIAGEKVSLIDFNRSGVPLVEIVTEPDFRAIDEVDEFLKKLQRLIRYLGISGADMEKGSMRLEPSISIAKIQDTRYKIQKLPDYRVELKNINSFRFGRRALEYEIKRQTELLDKGEKVTQQTRGWSEQKSATVPQREKEEAHDYRYFPEPDIPPMSFTKTEIQKIKNQIPELPDQKLARFIKQYGLIDYDANILVETRETADYFEEAVKVGKIEKVSRKVIANWVINKKATDNPEPAGLVKQIVLASKGVAMSDEVLTETITRLFSKYPRAVADYRAGKKGAINILIGELLKDPLLDKQKVVEAIRSKLENE